MLDEWVVYNGSTGSSVEHKVYCESWEDWMNYANKYMRLHREPPPNKMVARGLTQEQAEAMVQMTRED
jgi:phage terminase large subunit-like protein